MKFLIVFACVALAAADVSHLSNLSNEYLPPGQHASIVSHGVAPVVSSYSAPAVQSYVAPAVQTYSAPAVQTYSAPAVHTYSAPAAYQSYSAPSVASTSYLAPQVDYASQVNVGSYDGGYDAGYDASNLVGGGVVNGGLLGSGLSANLGGLHTSTGIVSSPIVSNSYESVGTEYGSNGGYVYHKH